MSEGSSSAAANTSPLAGAATEVVAVVARSAAGELAKGGRPLGEVTRTAVADAAETVNRRAPALAEEAGIVNWRYALLGWLTWQIGKRIVKRKTKAVVARQAPSHDNEEA